MQTKTSSHSHVMYGISLILAPLLQFTSSFFWVDGEYGVTGGTILVFSILFWMPALIAMFGMLKQRTPNYAEWGLLIAIPGFISGVGFAFVGVFAEIFSISHEEYIKAFSKYPVASNLLLFQSGPLAPLSLVVFGIVLTWTRVVERRIGLLIILGGIAFPLSRISRIEWVAHFADLLLLIPMAELGVRILNRKRS